MKISIVHFIVPFILVFLFITYILAVVGFGIAPFWDINKHKYSDCYTAIDAKKNFNDITEDILEQCEANPVPQNRSCDNLIFFIADFQKSGITEIYNGCLFDNEFVNSLSLKDEFKIIDIKVADDHILKRINVLFDL